MALSTKVAIKNLCGLDDYSTWKFAIKMILIREKLFTYTSKYPDSNDSTAIEKDQDALVLICLHVDTSLYTYVQDSKYAKDAWDSLAKAFEDKGVNRRITLMNALLDEKLERHSSMHDYVAAVMSLSQKLKDIATGFDDDLVAVVLLRGLPEEYRPMRMALEHSGMKLTSENVRQKLLQEDSRQGCSTSSSTDSALAVSKSRKRNGNKDKNMTKVKCYRCGKHGHKKPDCPEGRKADDSTSKTKDVVSLSSSSAGDSFNPTEWYIDSGASSHMSFQKHWFKDLVMNVSMSNVTCANNDKMECAGKGDIMVSMKGRMLAVRDVMYVPGLRVNLLSVSQLVERGWKVIFDRDGCKLIHHLVPGHFNGKLLATASEVSGIYKLEGCQAVVDGAALASVKAGNPLMLWHRRLGHVNERDLRKLPGMDFGKSVMEPCIACIKGKAHRLPFPVGEAEKAVERLQLVHADICGPMSEPSYGGSRYMLVILDDFTRKTFAFFLKSKDQVLDHFKVFLASVEVETGLKVKCIRTDNGTEFVNNKFDGFLRQMGIKHQLTVPYTPEQNGVVERANRTIVEMARTMLAEKNLSWRLWADACSTAVYTKNRLPHSGNNGKIPEELWTGKAQSFDHFRVFGSKAFVHVPKEIRKKWSPKAVEHIFVGYCEETKGYRFINPSNPRVTVRARDVVFLEDSTAAITGNPSQLVGSSDKGAEVIWEFARVEGQSGMSPRTEEASQGLSSTDEAEVYEDAEVEVGETGDSGAENVVVETVDRGESNEVECRYPLRNRIRDRNLHGLACCTGEQEPLTVKEALSREDKDNWKEAMKKEMDSMYENKVWKLVDKPPGAKIVGNKWIFKYKYDADGNRTYKARLVAKGFTQSYGVDYFETYSPVVRRSTVRLLLSLAVEKDLFISHFDVNTAFLNGDLHEKVYMRQPEGCIDNDSKEKVCLLEKAIYGLKQASRSWNEKVNEVLLSLNFKRCDFDSCLYKNNNFYIALYVDDFLLFYKDRAQKEVLLDNLRKHFTMKDLGEARQVLGMLLSRTDTGIYLNQERLISKILDEYGMSDCKPVKTPMEIDFHKALAEGEGGKILSCQDYRRYQALIGSLNYLACNTRPDIAAAVNFLAQYNSCCEERHWKAAKHILRYLRGTRDLCLIFPKSPVQDITGFVDADWGGNIKDRKSYSGFIFRCGNSLINWECRKQACVALSSTEAEYIALSEATKEAVHLRQLNAFIKGESLGSICIFVDNQSAMKLAYNPVAHRRTKHIDIRAHYVRDCIAKNVVRLDYVCTQDNPADVLTKPLGRVAFTKCVRDLSLGVCGVV